MTSTNSSPVPWLRWVRYGVAGLLATILLVGCVRILEPRQNNIRYYLLDGRPGPKMSNTDTTGLRVGLREPLLASYLDAARIVTRHGANTIRFSDFHRWGEDLDRGINRVVARSLAAQKGIYLTKVVPWSNGSSFDYIVEMHVLQFEGHSPRPPSPEDESDEGGTGHSQMSVEWTILDGDRESVQTRSTTSHREDGWPVNDYGALVSRLDTSLIVLADSIGARLQTLQRADRSSARTSGDR